MDMDATNKKLLSEAARAYGDRVEGWTVDADFVPVAILQSGARWQPLLPNRLTDCMGDALRLAVKLGLDLCVSPNYRLCAWNSVASDWVEEPPGNDPCAAMRLCIVRAAAAMAEESPA